MPPLTPRFAPVPEGHTPDEFYDPAGLVGYYEQRLAEAPADDPSIPELKRAYYRASRAKAEVDLNVALYMEDPEGFASAPIEGMPEDSEGKAEGRKR